MQRKDAFSEVLYALPLRIASVLSKLPRFVKNEAYEIRLRENKPVRITGKTSFYISEDALACTYIPKNPLRITGDELKESLLLITERSVYTRGEELKQGYLSMRNGHRAGVCGSFSGEGLLSVSSLNIRIARQILGSADLLLSHAENGLIIAGPPGSGKTTMLRDLVRQLSDGGAKISLIDSRGEIYGGGLDVGINTDVISGLSKAQGAENALRSMFPDYIAFDEIGTGAELSLVKESFFSGVKILTTLHTSGIEDLRKRAVSKELLLSGIGEIALISKNIGDEITFLKTDEVKSIA